MKKIFLSLLAVAALASCTKSEVILDHENEIGFAPSTKNITKASGLSGALSTVAPNQRLGIWAFWDNDGQTGAVLETATNDNKNIYSNYTDNYLTNALFAKRSNTGWGGVKADGTAQPYPWPTNGALVFAGYTTPGADVLASTNVSYNLGNDVMTFTNYSNETEFDLCWFGRTSNSYNYRNSTQAVPVELSHALSWISIAVYGDGTPVGNWKITEMTLNSIPVSGTATCNGETKKATWENLTTQDSKKIFTGTHTIKSAQSVDGKLVGEELSNNLIIPTTPLQLTINYSFTVGTAVKTDSKSVSLKLDDANFKKWESGVHYIYTLKFTGNEILIAPSYGEWATEDRTITVE